MKKPRTDCAGLFIGFICLKHPVKSDGNRKRSWQTRCKEEHSGQNWLRLLFCLCLFICHMIERVINTLVNKFASAHIVCRCCPVNLFKFFESIRIVIGSFLYCFGINAAMDCAHLLIIPFSFIVYHKSIRSTSTNTNTKNGSSSLPHDGEKSVCMKARNHKIGGTDEQPPNAG